MSFPTYADLLMGASDLAYIVIYLMCIVVALVASRMRHKPFRFGYVMLAWLMAAGGSALTFLVIGDIFYSSITGG